MKIDPKEHLERQGIPFCEVYPSIRTPAGNTVNCRTSDASTFAVGFARSREQYIFVDRQHTNYLILISRLLRHDEFVEDDFFDTLPVGKVIHELAMIRLAERSLNLRRSRVSLAYAILSRETVLFPRIFGEFIHLTASGPDLASQEDNLAEGLATAFVGLHESAHLSMQWGMPETDPLIKEIVHAFASVYKSIKTEAERNDANGKNSLARIIYRCATNVMSNRSLMEEVTADMMALEGCWRTLRERFSEFAKETIPIMFQSVLRCLAASSVLGIFDYALITDDPDILKAVCGTYRDLSFIRFEFLLGFAKCLVLKEVDKGGLTMDLYDELDEIANELRPRVFPMLNEQLEFITSGAIRELEREGAAQRIEEGLGNDRHARFACAMSLGWCSPESLKDTFI